MADILAKHKLVCRFRCNVLAISDIQHVSRDPNCRACSTCFLP
jgi:hypothetical protein